MTQMTDEAGQQEALSEQASAKVQDAASAAQEKAVELREQGSARMREQFDRRSTETGAQMRGLADALRRTANDLEYEDKGTATRLTGEAADRIDRIGGYLEQKSGDELMRDIESFARRRPWMLAGLGLLAGVAVARFAKASSEQRYASDRGTSGQRPRTTGYGTARGGVNREDGLGDFQETEGPAGHSASQDPAARDQFAVRS
jgi:ElaB/YqjD/DUF883 family membrane-anchored ribosome-binding protein